MFELEAFLEDCKRLRAEYDTPHAMREAVQRAVEDPAALVKALGEPTQAGVERLYVADDLTVLNISWGPRMQFLPHDHGMWAVIGIYAGQEDNTFYRRDPEGGLTPEGFKELHARESIPLGPQAIHNVANPLEKLTSAIHVYGGDFFSHPRREWDPESFEERPYDLEANLRRFEAANERWAALQARQG